MVSSSHDAAPTATCAMTAFNPRPSNRLAVCVPNSGHSWLSKLAERTTGLKRRLDWAAVLSICAASAPFRRLSGYFTYIITTRRITSGDVGPLVASGIRCQRVSRMRCFRQSTITSTWNATSSIARPTRTSAWPRWLSGNRFWPEVTLPWRQPRQVETSSHQTDSTARSPFSYKFIWSQ